MPSWFFELYTEVDGRATVLEDFQVKYLNDQSTFKITKKSRQAGGSLIVSMAKMFRAIRNEGYRCDIVSINLREAIDKISYIRKLHDTLPRQVKASLPLMVDNATSIGFHKGAKRSVVNSIAASSGVRGGKKEMVFDEAPHIANFEELYYAAGPAILNGDLTLEIVSTPRGDGDLFSRIWFDRPNERGRKIYSNYSRHEFIWLDVRRFVTDFDKVQNLWYNVYEKDMSIMDDLIEEFATEKLLQFYEEYPKNMFLQEFCGVFLDETLAFFPQALIDKAIHYPKLEVQDGKVVHREKAPLDEWVSRPKTANENHVVMGVDFGESDKDTDKTSIQIVEKLENGMHYHRYSEVLKKDDYPTLPEQARHVAEVAKKFKVNQLNMDGTGLGRGLCPLLQELTPDIPQEHLTFDYLNKEQMTMNIKTLLEKDKLWLLSSAVTLHRELKSIQKTTTAAGRNLYSGEPHDDAYWSLALACKKPDGNRVDMFFLGGRRS